MAGASSDEGVQAAKKELARRHGLEAEWFREFDWDARETFYRGRLRFMLDKDREMNFVRVGRKVGTDGPFKSAYDEQAIIAQLFYKQEGND